MALAAMLAASRFSRETPTNLRYRVGPYLMRRGGFSISVRCAQKYQIRFQSSLSVFHANPPASTPGSVRQADSRLTRKELVVRRQVVFGTWRHTRREFGYWLALNYAGVCLGVQASRCEVSPYVLTLPLF